MIIIIQLTKQRLILEEREMLDLLKKNPDIWQKALKRGKAFKRQEFEVKRLYNCRSQKDGRGFNNSL